MREIIFIAAASVAACGCSMPPSQRQIDGPVPTISTLEQPTRPLSVCHSVANSGRIKETKLSDVAGILRGGDFKKREVETTEEFKKRVAPRIAQVQKAAANRDLIFSVPIPNDKLAYNADRGTMKIGADILGLLETDF